MKFDFDFLVFIGRFQPFHNGHLSVVTTALENAQNLIVLLGSAHQPRSVRNPWSYQEREIMIRGALSDSDDKRVFMVPLMDVPYNDELWVRNIQETVAGLVRAHHQTPHRPARIGLVGHHKDHTSYYINLFPQWGSVHVPSSIGIDATLIREALFDVNGQSLKALQQERLLPASVQEFLARFAAGPDYQAIKQEYEYVQDYLTLWENTPFPVSFNTVDAVVIQSGHVLMIQRRTHPGKDLYALPGGFVDRRETLETAMLRELKEETRINVPKKVLRGSIRRREIFDDPHRSSRGRVFTHGFLIELPPGNTLPKVRGADDAKSATWIPLGELDPCVIFEDHYAIIQKLIGL